MAKKLANCYADESLIIRDCANETPIVLLSIVYGIS
jgi:hypothetical protein